MAEALENAPTGSGDSSSEEESSSTSRSSVKMWRDYSLILCCITVAWLENMANLKIDKVWSETVSYLGQLAEQEDIWEHKTHTYVIDNVFEISLQCPR